MSSYMTKFYAKPHSFLCFVIPPLKLRFVVEIVTPFSTALGTELLS